ncbi:MAG: HAMP domain-containing sensor histidine kinase [Bdellovibrionota bacterium]|mgnify:CR=1 FL=1
MRLKHLFHPITIFILSIVALGMSLFLYIHWYLKATDAFEAFAEKYGLDSSRLMAGQTWAVILTLYILVGIILFGMLLIFIYYQKVIGLYRQQQNFINGFTHELKTPVASLKLYLDTFKKHPLPRQDQLQYIDYMLSDVERLSGNIGRILNLAKIEDRQHLDELQVVNLYDFTASVLTNNAHIFPPSKVQLHPVSDKTLYNYPVMAGAFEIMLMNLILNGLTHNHSKTPLVILKYQVSNKGEIILTVTDNGLGIPKDERKKIFRKFYQIGSAPKGNGLGLFLVHQIIKLHRGKVHIDDSPQGGSIFTTILPARCGLS